jgi:hypothetical protein
MYGGARLPSLPRPRVRRAPATRAARDARRGDELMLKILDGLLIALLLAPFFVA